MFAVEGQRPWMRSHGYVPTALALSDRIRVYAAFWDAARIGRIGYVDLAADDPTRVLGFCKSPALDVGAPGTFDEHGVTPMSVAADGAAIRLYYAGWQRCETVRYRLFTGLAVSVDGGATFARLGDAPVIGRSAGHDLVRTGFVAFDQDAAEWRGWIAQSDGQIDVAGRPTPTYRLAHLRSADGVVWPPSGPPCFAENPPGVFGVGRSAVWRDETVFHGMFSLRTAAGYRIEHAISSNGRTWEPCRPEGFSLLPGHTEPRQAETMFPSVVNSRDCLYVFYNGNDFGKAGIRCARWDGGGALRRSGRTG